jgi:hypothetical protein
VIGFGDPEEGGRGMKALFRRTMLRGAAALPVEYMDASLKWAPLGSAARFCQELTPQPANPKAGHARSA